jgi:hypothetical protein
MRIWDVAAVGLMLLAGACSNSTSERVSSGGAGPSAGHGGEGGEAPGEGGGGINQVPTGAAGSAAGDEGSAGDGGGGFGGMPDPCNGDYDFGTNGEAGASYGSASALAEVVGSWRLARDVAGDDVYVLTIYADGAGSYTEQVAAHGAQPASTTVSSGTIHVGMVVIVLDVTDRTITTASGTKKETTVEPLTWAYKLEANSDPETLSLSPADCGALSYDPFERQ